MNRLGLLALQILVGLAGLAIWHVLTPQSRGHRATRIVVHHDRGLLTDAES